MYQYKILIAKGEGLSIQAEAILHDLEALINQAALDGWELDRVLSDVNHNIGLRGLAAVMRKTI